MRGTGKLVRAGITAQVALGIVLASAIAIGLTWLSERPGVRVRYDLTSSKENTFDEETRRKIEALPAKPATAAEHFELTGDRTWLDFEQQAERMGDSEALAEFERSFAEFAESNYTLEVDVFFVSYVQPMTAIGAELQDRFYRLLALVKESRRDIIELTRHELEGPVDGRIEAERRMRELGFRDTSDAMNAVVLSYGGRHVTIRLFGNVGDVAEVDLGSLRGQGGEVVPPRIVSYRGEEALVRALLKVSSLGEPRVLFSWGHGERDIYAEGDRQLSRLKQALLADGFSVARWDADEVGAVPDDCDVLAIIGPQQPFSEVEREWIREFVARGGRLIGAPGNEEREGEGGLPDLLAEYGILRQAGIVCRPYMGPSGELLHGRPECMNLSIRSQHMARHAITEPIRRGDRRVSMVFARPLVRGKGPEGGVLLDLIESDSLTWADLPGPDGAGDVIYTEGAELMGPFPLAIISKFPLAQAAPAPEDGVTARKDARVLAFGTPEVFGDLLFQTNRDLLLNSFNWAADREFRVSISTRDPERRVVPLGEGKELLYIHRVTVIGLPLLCLALGLLRWLSRRAT